MSEPIERYVEELERLTAETLDKLDIATSDELLEFTERRGELLETIVEQASSLPPEQVRLIKKRIEAATRSDPRFVARMEQLKEESLVHLRKMQEGKQQRDAYQSAYESNDSYFFDKKR